MTKKAKVSEKKVPMGNTEIKPYRLLLMFKLQIGLMIRYSFDLKMLMVELPFLSIVISMLKSANGIKVYGNL